MVTEHHDPCHVIYAQSYPQAGPFENIPPGRKENASAAERQGLQYAALGSRTPTEDRGVLVAAQKARQHCHG